MMVNQELARDEWLNILEKIERIVTKNFNISISIKLLNEYLLGLTFLRKFKEKIAAVQNLYAMKYLKEKNKKYKKLVDRLPYRDLARNRFLIDLPNFSQNLKESYLPLLVHAKEHMLKCLAILKGECLFFENGLRIEEILINFSEICLLIREYRARIRYHYVDMKELEEKFKSSGKDGALIEQQLVNLEVIDNLDKKNLEL